MNPRVAHVALCLVGVGIVMFLAFLVLVGGCGSRALPPEPPFMETASIYTRD